MYRIRNKPLSAKSSCSPGTHKNSEEVVRSENNKDLSLRHYDSKADKNCIGFFHMKNEYKKQRLKKINTIRSNASSNKDSRNSSSYRKDLTLDQLDILKEELILT